MSNVPDSFGEEDIFPRTVGGKIDLMISIGKELIAKADEMIKVFEFDGLPIPGLDNTGSQVKILGVYTLKLASIVQLQTECIEQMWNELKQPG